MNIIQNSSNLVSNALIKKYLYILLKLENIDIYIYYK